MKRAMIFLVSLSIILPLLCTCAPIKRPLDKRIGFSKQLKDIETHIEKEEWPEAQDSLKKTLNTWKGVKPILQLDIDHDYVNEIENNFAILSGYIKTREKADSMATILLIQDIWRKIGSM
jgi:hypothetical protein